MDLAGDPYADLKRHRATPEMVGKVVRVPRKIQKRREQFVKVPWTWMERLASTQSANTYRLAWHLLHQHWKHQGKPFLLSNGMLAIEGVTRFSKWRALVELEQFGLITIERRTRKSPQITVIV